MAKRSSGNEKTIPAARVICPEADSGMEELLDQLEKEGWTRIAFSKEPVHEEKRRQSSPFDEANRLLREYDLSVIEKVGAKCEYISHEQLKGKIREFSRLQGVVDRRFYLEGIPIVRWLDDILGEIEDLVNRPLVRMTPTEELFARYFATSDDLMLALDSAYERYRTMMESVRKYKDDGVLKVFVDSIKRKKELEEGMGVVNSTFERTGEQLRDVKKSHPMFRDFYIAYNNLRRRVIDLTAETEKTCLFIVVKDEEMKIMSEHEEILTAEVAWLDRERAYLRCIRDHARETFSIYRFSRELNTAFTSVSNSAKSLSDMTYGFTERILRDYQDIVNMEKKMGKERLLPRIQDRISTDYKTSNTATAGQKGSSGFVEAANRVIESSGVA